MSECKHEWKEIYNGIKCAKCELFYPDNGNYFAPLGDDCAEDDEDYRSYDCTCESCLQSHPARDILYGDGDYFKWDFDEEDE